MKKEMQLTQYKQSFLGKIVDLIYLKITKNKDIDELFLKNSILIKRPIIQEYAVEYLCENFEINRLKSFLPKISAIVKQNKQYQIKNAILNYIDDNLEKIDEIVMELPTEFKVIAIQKKENYKKKLEVSNIDINIMEKLEKKHSELFKSLTEVKVILTGLNEEVVNCIPTNFINFIEENYDKNYIPDINPLININKQKLLDKTKVLLAIIYRKYVRL